MVPRTIFRLIFTVIAGVAGTSAAVALSSPSDKPAHKVESPAVCLECHADRSLVSDARPGVSLFVDRPVLERSVHKTLNCVDCHQDADVEDFPHESRLKPARCDGCHDAESKAYSISRHRDAAVRGNSKAPDCVTCHGGHDIVPSRDISAKTYPLNINKECMSCHDDRTQPHAAQPDFADRVHGQGAMSALKVTAVCTNCHNSHDVLRHTDRNSSTSKARLASTCAVCHGKIEDLHAKVISPAAEKRGIEALAECGGCHALHARRKTFSNETFSDEFCLNCHSTSALSANRVPANLQVDQAMVDSSIHRNLHCIECHTDVSHQRAPVCAQSKPVDCASCHSAVVAAYDSSAHGMLFARGDTAAPSCRACHGTHGIRSSADLHSTTNRMQQISLCGTCHRKGEKAEVRSEKTAGMWEKYTTSIHGKGVMKSGLSVAAVCTDCHTTHGERPASDTLSSVSPGHIVKTCTRCHTGIQEQFTASVHSPTITKTDKPLPVCSSCHPSHEISRVDKDEFRNAMLTQCGTCHSEVTEAYFETYHGKSSLLGSNRSAKCSDCHGSHLILPATDSRSTLNAVNAITTCRQCHPKATNGFTSYITHAVYNSPKKYPALFFVYWGMTGLLVGVLSFFALHTLLWVPRSLHERLRYAQNAAQPKQRWVRRFSPFYRALHVSVVVSFLGLALTGMTIKFAYEEWAHVISMLFGGLEASRIIHRLCAVITFGYFGAHIVEIVRRIIVQKLSVVDLLFKNESMVPSLRDVKEFFQSVRWFVGKGPRPNYGRWTYWEKFDYLAVFWGVAIIGSSGMILWFPEFFTSFLPGWVVNIAMIVHSDEALLAVAFIFSIHFFNTHFRPEKFPMDMVIFTGKVPLDVFKEERPREYEEMVRKGELEKNLEPPPSPRLVTAARTFGNTALVIGVVLILLIAWALVFRGLFH